ncbi:MAG: hypothetical protein QY316_12945 [Thermodesulfobacteriota bacterium]|nr:MAG: hypothetical protein QY316_12945 [Thermodesulfobacteriota bacterium]
MEQDASHYRKMRNAIWLYLYLLLNADRKSGTLSRKLRTISGDMGISKNMIMRWLNILRTEGYIATKSNGRCLSIKITKWRGTDATKDVFQSHQTTFSRGFKNPNPQKPFYPQNSYNPSQKREGSFEPIDITIKRNILKSDIDNRNFEPEKGYKPRTEKELLAMDLAEALNDTKNLPLYLSYCNKYPEQLLRRVLGEVKELPREKIRKSRGALFNYLVQKYANKQDNQNPGH